MTTEAELVNNPDVYTEDPGSSCQPFQRPERILSERAVFSIVRVEQPTISADISGSTRDPFEVDENAYASIFGRPNSPILVNDDNWFAPWYNNNLWKLDHGRRQMDAQYPAQWEADSLRYQASTVSRGHILEYRITTRSNGYSRGGVAMTLNLAARATKRESACIIMIMGVADS